MSQVKIQNVVAAATLRQRINLNDIVKVFVNANYAPDRFPGLVFRLKRPKTATLIFSTGKMVCTGARSEKMAKSAVRKVVRELKGAGFIIPGEPEMAIVNMVGTADVSGEVDLEATADILDNVMYEPEQFPGLIYRMDEPRVVLLVFRSGKLVITGAKREEQVHKAAEKTREILTEHGLIY